MRFLLSLLLVGSICYSSFAQITNVKKVRFGKASEEEINLANYPLDPDAEAVVLYDEGRLYMEVNPAQNSFQYVFERHMRIKIFAADAVGYANFNIPLEQSGRSADREEISSIKGMTYNVVNGETVATKLDKNSIIYDRQNEYLHFCKILLPQVKEGSLIELQYTIKSDFTFNLPRWNFQKEIPVDYSFYEVTIPEYYRYRVDMTGYASDRLTESVTDERGTGNATITYRTDDGPSASFTDAGPSNTRRTQVLNFSTQTYRWIAQEVPSLVREPHAPETDDYLFHVDFELASTNFPGGGRSYSQTWEDVSKTYLGLYSVKQYLQRSDEVVQWVAKIVSADDSPKTTVLKLYEEVQDQVKWNGYNYFIPNERPAKLLSQLEGNSASINLLLLSAIRAMGIVAEPVLSSTRSNGYLSVTRPSITQFNQVLVFVELPSGGQFLLDASRQGVPATLLPVQDLNDRGRLITSEGSQWVDLKALAAEKSAIQVQVELNKEGGLSGSYKYKGEGYAALEMRQLAEQESAVPTVLNQQSGLQLAEVSCEDFTNKYADLVVNSSADASDYVNDGGELLYVDAVLHKWKTDNPLKAEERTMPVDFVVPEDRVYVMQLSLAEGLAIEELPESVNFSLPEGKGRYSLRFTEMNGNVQVIEKISFKETLFMVEEYAALRNFIDLVMENQSTVIVVKKT